MKLVRNTLESVGIYYVRCPCCGSKNVNFSTTESRVFVQQRLGKRTIVDIVDPRGIEDIECMDCAYSEN